MKNLKLIKQAINKEYPEFDISSVKKMGEGDNSKAFLINKNYIFRFAKREDVKVSFRKEIKVLPKIEPFLPLQIPKLKFVSKETDFVGYKSIPGEFMSAKIYKLSGKKVRKQLQISLSKFLSNLHNIDLGILKDCGLETMNYKEEYSNDYIKIQRLIFPNISIKKKNLITEFYHLYLDNKNNFEYNPSLIHNDFSQDHILLRKSTKEVNGIIDFGDIAIGDPDYDLMYLSDNPGAKFIQEMLQFYNPDNYIKLMKKLSFFSMANKLQIIIEDIERNDAYLIKKGYKKLDKWFDQHKKKNSFFR